MSKAFTKEPDGDEAEADVPDSPDPLPQGADRGADRGARAILYQISLIIDSGARSAKIVP